MKRISLALVAVLLTIISIGSIQGQGQSIPQFRPVGYTAAGRPLFLSLDSTGALSAPGTGSSQAVGNQYIPPIALQGVDSTGHFHFILVDNTGAVVTTGGQGGSGVPNVNGITAAVTIEAADSSIHIDTIGNSVKISSPGGGSGGTSQITVTITAAQFKAMTGVNIGSITIIPAPGANKIIVPLSLIWIFIPSTTPYVQPDGSFQMSIFPAGTPLDNYFNLNADIHGLGMDQTVSNLVMQQGLNSGDTSDIYVNKAVVFGCSNFGALPITVGDGVLKISVAYAVVDIS